MALAYLVILLGIPYLFFEVLISVLDFIIFAPIVGIEKVFDKVGSFFVDYKLVIKWQELSEDSSCFLLFRLISQKILIITLIFYQYTIARNKNI